MSQYRTGTVTVTQNSQAVVGSGTAWSANVEAGDLFSVQATGVPYIVGSVTDDTHLTLSTQYAAATASGQDYLISTSFTPGSALPYPEAGDIDTPTILKRAFLLLDRTVDAWRSINMAGSPNTVVLTDTQAGTRLLQLVGTGSAGATLVVPAEAGFWLIYNSTGVSVSVQASASPLGTAATILSGALLSLVYCDATNCAVLQDSAQDPELTKLATLVATDGAVIIGQSSPTEWSTLSGAALRSAIGLAINSDVQAYAARLGLLAGLAPGDNYAMIGLGSPAEWAAATPAQARTALGVAINVDVQAYSARLGLLAGLAPGDNYALIGLGSPAEWAAATPAQARTALGLAINADVQAYSARLGLLADLAPGDSYFLIGSGSPAEWAARTPAQARAQMGVDFDGITFIIDGGGSAITTGVKGDIEVPWDCTVIGWTVLLDQGGLIQVDIWKDTYANFPPTVADTITGNGKPRVIGSPGETKNQDLTLAGSPTSWTTINLTKGDILRFNVDSVSVATRATIALRVLR